MQARGLARAAAVAGVMALVTTTAAAQEGKSAAGAKELAQVLRDKKLDAIAARDPGSPNGFVAALHFPGQLMVMSATYPAPALLNERLARREYRDIYIEINSASPVDSRMFLTDIGADGLRARRAKRDDPFDVRHKAGTPLNFDGNWRAQKLSEDEYMKAFAEADDRYAQAIALLLAEAKK
jgi:hypothetical protein